MVIKHIHSIQRGIPHHIVVSLYKSRSQRTASNVRYHPLFFEIWSGFKDRKLSLPSNKGQQLSIDLILIHKCHMKPQAEESQRAQHVGSNGFFLEVLQLPYNHLGDRQTCFVGRSL